MSSASKIIQAAAGNAAGEGLYVEEVFSTYLYTGDNNDITITNGIDLDGEGGMVWIKKRDVTEDHGIVDTERGGGNVLRTNATSASQDKTGDWDSFNSDGFSLGGGEGLWSGANDYVSWTFRKAPKFFDVVTYTGDGTSGKTISHNLGVAPGCVIIKRTDSTSNWTFWHRSLTAENFLRLNLTDAEVNAAFFEAVSGQGNVNPTDSVITLGNSTQVNANNGTYVAYLFAHNDGDGDFGESGDQDIIKCGSFTEGASEVSVNLGFEPQWVLKKSSSVSGSWEIVDNMRGIVTGGDDPRLFPNSSNAENTSFDSGSVTATGFTHNPTYGAGATIIYIAIRRGPMKTPESGTEVFALSDAGRNVAFSTGFPVDAWLGANKDATSPNNFCSRLTGGGYLNTAGTDAELTSSGVASAFSYTLNTDNQDEFIQNTFGSTNRVDWVFRRAPGFFDVVAYEGNGTAGRTVDHNLGVAPEFMIFKRRNNTGSWSVWHKDLTTPSQAYVFLNLTNAQSTATTIWNDTYPALESSFVVGDISNVNTSGDDYIAYLFATVPGVSKVGSYTGNGTSQTIDCGFSAGARFILIKRTDSTSNWNVFDTERGIVAGNDPRLELNTTDAEDTGDDGVDPDSSGFAVNYIATNDDDVNVSGGTYIFLAIA